jgi:hypothetical protein
VYVETSSGSFFMFLLFCSMFIVVQGLFLLRNTKNDCSKIKRIWFVFINTALCTELWKPKIDGPYIMTKIKTPKPAIKRPRVPESEKNKDHNYVTKTSSPAWRYHKDYQLRIFFLLKINNKLWPQAPEIILHWNDIKCLPIKLTFII